MCKKKESSSSCKKFLAAAAGFEPAGESRGQGPPPYLLAIPQRARLKVSGLQPSTKEESMKSSYHMSIISHISKK